MRIPEYYVRDVEVVSSNLTAPTILKPLPFRGGKCVSAPRFPLSGMVADSFGPSIPAPESQTKSGVRWIAPNRSSKMRIPPQREAVHDPIRSCSIRVQRAPQAIGYDSPDRRRLFVGFNLCSTSRIVRTASSRAIFCSSSGAIVTKAFFALCGPHVISSDSARRLRTTQTHQRPDYSRSYRRAVTLAPSRMVSGGLKDDCRRFCSTGTHFGDEHEPRLDRPAGNAAARERQDRTQHNRDNPRSALLEVLAPWISEPTSRHTATRMRPTPTKTAPPRGCTAGVEFAGRRSAQSGTRSSSSRSHTSASLSLGARQSLRGESEPPEPTFGPLGIAERLN